jgi:diguanylate cyclase (GGDEF)-like protein
MEKAYLFALTGVFSIFSLTLAYKNKLLNQRRNRYYIMAVLVSIIALFAESIGSIALNNFFMENYNIKLAIVIAYLTNMTVYIITPFLPLSLILMIRGFKRDYDRYMVIPAVINAILALSTPWTHALFYISAENQYSRGTLFVPCFMISAFYAAVFIYEVHMNFRGIDHQERIYLSMIFLVASASVFLQMFVPKIQCMWPSISLGLLLYYTFIIEFNSGYDALTNVYNRNSFEEWSQKTTSMDSYTMIVADINGLKRTNDTYGHDAGDELIIEVAMLLSASFACAGKIYRIGGDEFCIVCQGSSGELIAVCIQKMKSKLEKAANRDSSHIPLQLSYGIVNYSGSGDKSAEDVFKEADQTMYEMKDKYYQKHPELGTRRMTYVRI